MTIREQINKIRRLHFLIQKKATGSPSNLANKLSMSNATLYRYLNELKQDGANIKYNKIRETYYYEKEYVLKF